MDAPNYRDRVENALSAADYEPTEAETSETVWHKKTEDPTIGVTHVCVAVIDADDIDEQSLESTAEEFRDVLSEIAPAKPGGMKNLFGYIVFADTDISDPLIEFATEEYTVADRRTSVFPLLFDLATETLHLHPIPRLKGRGFYEKQKLDAESLFTL